MGVFAGSGVERLKLAEAGGGQPFRGNSLFDQELDHRNRSRRRQLPVGGKLRGGDPARIGVAVDAQNPVHVGGNCPRDINESPGKLGQLALAGLLPGRRAGGEQHFRLENESVADDSDVGTGADRLAQPAEELGAVARQFLHLAGQGGVEPAAEVGDLELLLAPAGLGGVEGGGEARQFGAQRGDFGAQGLDAPGVLGGLAPGRRKLAPTRLESGLKLAHSRLPALDLLLGQGGALGFAGHPGLKLLGTVAQGGQLFHQRPALGLGELERLALPGLVGGGAVEAGGQVFGLALEVAGQQGQRRDFGFKAGAGLGQRLDVCLEGGYLAQLHGDLFAVGVDGLVGALQVFADPAGVGAGGVGALAEGDRLGRQLVALVREGG